MKKRNSYISRAIGIFGLLFACLLVESQPKQEYIKVVVSPGHSDWNYLINEKVNFKIRVLKANVPLENVTVSYTINQEKMPVRDSAQVVLPEGEAVISTKGLPEPGFLRCTASFEYENKTYSGVATAGFEPDKIEPTCKLPPDFNNFWTDAKNQLGEIPLEPFFRELPERATSKVNVYEVSFNNISGKIYGILCVPKIAGTYPALLDVPGAGVWPMYGDIKMAEQGIITLAIGIHGIPLTMDPSVYQDLSKGSLKNYWFNNLDKKDSYYFKRVFLGCVRAVDFIHSLPEFDSETLAVYGGSQGGALSIITASLDTRIDYLGVFYPAFCDHTGFLNHRAGGWPFHFMKDPNPSPEKVKNSAYYDVVNFARFVKVPGFYSWGYNDWACPPTSTFSAYNSITAPKELFVVPETGHWIYPEQQQKMENWLIYKLTKNR